MTIWELSQILGNIGEFFGAIAVVVSLIYIGIQFKEGAKQTRLNTETELASILQDGFSPIYNNSDNLQVWSTGMSDPNKLEGADKNTFFMFMQRLFNNYEMAVSQFEAGTLNKGQFDGYTKVFRELASTKGGQVWFSEAATFSPHISSGTLEYLEIV